MLLELQSLTQALPSASSTLGGLVIGALALWLGGSLTLGALWGLVGRAYAVSLAGAREASLHPDAE